MDRERQMLGIERLIRRGGGHLAEALYAYWPAEGNNEIAERNLSLHLGRAFSDGGYQIYGEVHSEASTDRRYDLLAYEPAADVMVVGEFKRLYSSEQAQRIVDDLDRIRAFRPRKTPHPVTLFGLVAATTWSDEYAEWWSVTEAPGAAPSDADCWQALYRFGAAVPEAIWGSTVLAGYDPEISKFHYMVYLLFPLPQ